MKKENILLVLWIIYGFLFITAVDSVLYLFIHLVYFALFIAGVSLDRLSVVLPIFTIIVYGFITVLLLRKINTSSRNNGVYLTDFPLKWTVILGLIVIIIKPLTNWLSSKFGEYYLADSDLEWIEILSFIGKLKTGFTFAQFLIITALIIYFVIKSKAIKINKVK